jgi:hypothetical protein
MALPARCGGGLLYYDLIESFFNLLPLRIDVAVYCFPVLVLNQTMFPITMSILMYSFGISKYSAISKIRSILFSFFVRPSQWRTNREHCIASQCPPFVIHNLFDCLAGLQVRLFFAESRYAFASSVPCGSFKIGFQRSVLFHHLSDTDNISSSSSFVNIFFYLFFLRQD